MLSIVLEEARRSIASNRPQRKVTIFVTRNGQIGCELVLFWHSGGGLQVPAGSVEPDETFKEAALREAREETGLRDVEIVREIDSTITHIEPPNALLLEDVALRSTPDGQSTAWRPGRTTVTVLDHAGSWVLVEYQERDLDRLDRPITAQLTGWVPADCLTRRQERQFFLARSHDNRHELWIQQGEPQHTFTVSWQPLQPRPDVVPDQQEWIDYLDQALRRRNIRAR